MTSVGGDAGYGAWIGARAIPRRPVLVFTSMDWEIETDKPADWNEVKLQLQDDGMFHVIDSTHVSVPAGDDPGLITSDEPACGVAFYGLMPQG